MTATPKVIVAAQDLANASALLYTSPANGKGTWIDKATATNHVAATHTVTVYLVPSGGSAGGTNVAVQAKPVAAAATDLLPEVVGKFLGPGDMIYAFADAAASVNIGINGRELT